MEKFRADVFYLISRTLESLRLQSEAPYPNEQISERSKKEIEAWLVGIVVKCEEIGLRLAIKHARRIKEELPGKTRKQLAVDISELTQRIEDEMEQCLFLHIENDRVEFYDQGEPLFGPEVASKWPNLAQEISEGGKCLALGRFTACVFHMMRVMEVGVQEFGKKLGVVLSTQKPWGSILNEAKVPIDSIPRGDPRKSELNEVWAHMDSVRLAWRNEVMHPKQTYTEEEAMDVFSHVRTYMRRLEKVI